MATKRFVMSRSHHAFLAACTLLLLTACGASRAAHVSAADAAIMGPEAAKARAAQDSLRYPYTQADVDFMSGMIHHHAQAILVSKWAEQQGASQGFMGLTGRIINAQTDEIRLMQTWLEDRNRKPPQVDSLGNIAMDHSAHGAHDMGGAMMPGMLTPAQLDSLKALRGVEFEKLFLKYMIQHHRGAISMVRTLFASHGAGQNETIFKFAADVEVDQSTEIKRMYTMLLERGVMPDSP
jgi:uncharacterized protein (DUF305 family)